MVTEVKLEGLQVLTNTQSIQQQKKKADTVDANNTGDVTVSNQLSSMISSLSLDEEGQTLRAYRAFCLAWRLVYWRQWYAS